MKRKTVKIGPAFLEKSNPDVPLYDFSDKIGERILGNLLRMRMPEHHKNSNSVLFVCTGNLCRSPMAETLFQDLLAKKLSPLEIKDWQIASAGTMAANGEPATLGAQVAMARRELSLINHHSQQVTSKLLARFKLVLVMEARHKEALQEIFPQYTKKIYLLSEMVGLQRDIADPIGGSLTDYEATAEEINGIIERGFVKIRLLAK